jgi:hypothetical protein
VQSVYPVPIATIFQCPATDWFGVSYHFEGCQPHYVLDTHLMLDDALRAADPHNERIWEDPSDADESKLLVSRHFVNGSVEWRLHRMRATGRSTKS